MMLRSGRSCRARMNEALSLESNAVARYRLQQLCFNRDQNLYQTFVK